MGIDRKDVRMVCHFNIPKSMEAFYQESGRAGRDQLPCRSLLYYGVDDRKRMEFILTNADSKKSQSSSSQDGFLKKSLSDFKQMVEYCEGSSCRRKKILESFGEEVPESLCKKSCDSCKHPNLVAKYLEELTTTCAARQRHRSSQIFISSSRDIIDRDQLSEFWNRDDEPNCSEEDISDSDDGIGVVKNLPRSNMSRKLGLNEKIEFLQRAEEDYYRSKKSQKQVNKPDKNAISETLRGTSKQRLLDAVKQAQERLGNFNIEFETSASLLENECYKKYGKRGKTFYYSQVASTLRWLSTTNSTELMNRLGASAPSPPEKASSLLAQRPTETIDPEIHGSAPSEISTSASPSQSTSASLQLPTIPSFSEYVNSKRKNDDHHQSPKKLNRTSSK